MKFRVIGWTNWDAELESGEDSPAANTAIQEDIRQHGYEFSGTDHQGLSYCAPVLNNGKIYRFSERGWGHIMAEAHGMYGDGDYVNYAWNWDPFNDTSVHPTAERAFDPAFIPETDLNESFEIEVTEEVFAAAVREHKIAIDDLPALKYLDAGDTLKLRCKDKTAEYPVIDVSRGKDLTDEEWQEYEVACIDVLNEARLHRAKEMYNNAKTLLYIDFAGVEYGYDE